MVELRNSWSDDFVRRNSAAVADRLARWVADRNVRILSAYRALRGEVDLTPCLAELAQAGVRLCLPVFDPDREEYAWADWAPGEPEHAGPLGIIEPAVRRWTDPAAVSLVIVPGLAFDREGRRLGRGGGHYDRLLARTAGPRVAVAFEPQLVDRLPDEPHDIRMDVLVTEEQIRAFPPPRGIAQEAGMNPEPRSDDAAEALKKKPQDRPSNRRKEKKNE